MHLLLTLAVLALLTAAIVVLRLFWTSLGRGVHRVLLVAAFAAILFYGLTKASNWSTTSELFNALLTWSALASYEFFLMLFTTLRPRKFTSIIAIVLALPLLSTSVVLELTYLFRTKQITIADLGYKFYSDKIYWDAKPSQSSGIDFIIYYRSGFLPLRRRVQGARLYDTQCITRETYAVLQPGHNSVLVVCPALPGQPAETGRHAVVPFY
ncbi:hypothetical protein [Granulicella sp. dw_53]|uniref:hypothetical protein n=1 Tax=Granulicella sp. dw_53 TaxID=2719792 RepID=UPI001BD5076F|nr:hypothetical protein [Granulicella sp. dw_53]